MDFMKVMHNQMMSIKMPNKMAGVTKYMGDRKKMMKEVRRRKGGKGESDGGGI